MKLGDDDDVSVNLNLNLSVHPYIGVLCIHYYHVEVQTRKYQQNVVLKRDRESLYAIRYGEDKRTSSIMFKDAKCSFTL